MNDLSWVDKWYPGPDVCAECGGHIVVAQKDMWRYIHGHPVCLDCSGGGGGGKGAGGGKGKPIAGGTAEQQTAVTSKPWPPKPATPLTPPTPATGAGMMGGGGRPTKAGGPQQYTEHDTYVPRSRETGKPLPGTTAGAPKVDSGGGFHGPGPQPAQRTTTGKPVNSAETARVLGVHPSKLQELERSGYLTKGPEGYTPASIEHARAAMVRGDVSVSGSNYKGPLKRRPAPKA